MKPLRVNVDYEIELFGGGPGPRGMNEALEFLAFFLVKEPILTQKNYDPKYLDYIERLTGVRPKFVRAGSYLNWWGPLENIPKEKWLNSKITSTELSTQLGWSPNTFIIDSKLKTPSLKEGMSYLIKDPHEMSGRGFRIIPEWSEEYFKGRSLIVEPFRNRKFDFSHYVFPNGETILYENIVDKKFQFKGTIFSKERSFLSQIKPSKWESFLEAIETIKTFYKECSPPGYSIDSFIYEDNGELEIHYLSEINARRTMGLTAYEISQKFKGSYECSALVMGKSLKAHGGFTYMQEKLLPYINETKVIVLSPGDTRFEMLFLMTENKEELLELSEVVSRLLPEGDFPLLSNT